MTSRLQCNPGSRSSSNGHPRASNLTNLLKIYQYMRGVTHSLYAGYTGHRTLQALHERCIKLLNNQINAGLGKHLQELTPTENVLCNVAIRFNRFFGAPKALLMTLPESGDKPGVSSEDLEHDFLGLYGIKNKMNKTLLVTRGELDREIYDTSDMIILDLTEKNYINDFLEFAEVVEKEEEEASYRALIEKMADSSLLVSADNLLKRLCFKAESVKLTKLNELRKELFKVLSKRIPKKTKRNDEIENEEANNARFEYFFQAINDDSQDDAVAFTFSYTQPLSQEELDLIRAASIFIADHLTLSVKGALYHRDEEDFQSIHGRILFNKIEKLKTEELISQEVNTTLLEAFPLLSVAIGDDVVSGQILLLVSKIASHLDIPGCAFDDKIKDAPEGPLIRILYYAIDFENKLKITPGYRQHFIHSFNVFLLGYYLLHIIYDKLFTEIKNIPPELLQASTDTNKLAILRCWFLSAFWHDCAYPLTNADVFSNELLKRMFVLPSSTDDSKVLFLSPADIAMLMTIDRHAIAASSILYQQYRTINNSAGIMMNKRCPNSGMFDGFWRDAALEKQLNNLMYKENDHGIPGAIILLNALLNCVNDGNYDKVGLDICFKYALDAIMFHDKVWSDWQKFIVTIPPHRNPIAFLLLICDLVQQWGRTPENKGKNKFNIKLEKITQTNNKYTIKLKYKNEDRNIQKITRAEAKKEIKDYIKDYETFTDSAKDIITVSFLFHCDGDPAHVNKTPVGTVKF